jgi:hypothetical protein
MSSRRRRYHFHRIPWWWRKRVIQPRCYLLPNQETSPNTYQSLVINAETLSRNNMETYGCDPRYPHDPLNAPSHTAVKYRCQGRNRPFRCTFSIWRMCTPWKSSKRDCEPGRSFLRAEGCVVRQRIAEM